MIYYVIIGMVAFAALVLGSVAIYYFATKRKYKKNKILYQKDQIVIKNKSSLKDVIDRIYQQFYIIATKLPIVSYYARKTRLKLEMVNDYTEYEIRRKTGSIMLLSLVFVFSALFIFLNIVNDFIMSLMIIIFVFIINDVIIDSRVNKVADKILRQIPEVFTEIRHSFHEHGMIEEAFNDTIEELDEKEITPQIRRIKEAITADNPEVALEKYYDTAPNRFLKLFAGVSYLTMELGDRKVDGISVYLKNLNNILNDTYLELLKKEKINYQFRSLSIIAVVPIFFISAIQSWSETNFPMLINFYNSSFGFLMKAIILIAIFGAYFLLKVIKEDSTQIKFDRIKTKRWQEKVYKWPIIKQIVNAIMPAEHSKKYRKKAALIKGINAYLTMEWYYVNKLAYAVFGFIVAIVIGVNLNVVKIQSVYTSISEEFLSLGSLSEEDRLAAEKMSENDKLIIQELPSKSDTNLEDIKTVMRKLGQTPTDEDAQRILDKLTEINDAYYKYWELIIAIVVGLIAAFIPDIMLFVKNKVREMEKEDEIMQFQSIILMLMYVERIDVQTLLEWLERYSYAFREPIATALNNYESGAVEALDELKDAVPHKDFKRIVEGLISAVERIPIRDAFDELETERSFYYERRKEANERTVQKKSSYGKVIGFTPLIILVVGYFVGPLLVVSILQLVNYFGQMQSM